MLAVGVFYPKQISPISFSLIVLFSLMKKEPKKSRLDLCRLTFRFLMELAKLLRRFLLKNLNFFKKILTPYSRRTTTLGFKLARTGDFFFG